MTKYIFVTGGVVSGLGKGITAASLGRLLKARGLKVAAQKLDPYINVDPGTMSPYQHGEVYVTEDGAETDLDLGHYERFIDEDLNKYSNLTTGKVYWNVICTRSAGASIWAAPCRSFPISPTRSSDFIYRVGREDQMRMWSSPRSAAPSAILRASPLSRPSGRWGWRWAETIPCISMSRWCPICKAPDEHKSKPTQHSVKELQGMGITPNIIVLRCDEPIRGQRYFPQGGRLLQCKAGLRHRESDAARSL